MIKHKSGLTRITHYRHFGLCVALLLVSVFTGTYFAYEHRYQLEVMMDDFVEPEDEVSAPAVDKRPKLIATFRDQPPNMFYYSKGRFSGPLRVMLEQATSEIGYALEWRQAALSASLTGLADNSVDIVPHIRSRTREREKLYRYSISIREEQRSIYFAQWEHDPKVISNLNDLEGMAVGYPQGNYFNTQFQQASHFKKEPYSSIESMVMAFHRQEITVMLVSSKREVEQRLQAVGARSVKYADFTLDDNPELYFLYSKNPALQAVYDRLDQALSDMKKRGEVEDIFHSFALAAPEKGSQEPSGYDKYEWRLK
ncbi:substrate-binding periplasmic protein [Thalassomonas actiniarum]|uniref:Transporter substrate-binding domain-containing protein n=1 Tax=Thalassomonas actiniarum TaxID=485447 RepID=A0AAE9YY28_9GAMM|nr:transporter substrate-binding domain-containing protein [Thalassomonas actiniarum]WDE02540.1 transporter substrate-binding domain-containing protein [Thalassomonas actiniarum]